MNTIIKGFSYPDSNVRVICGGDCDACNYCDDCSQNPENPEYVDFDSYYVDAGGNMPCDTWGAAACSDLCPRYAKCQGWE